jgi:predicted kinase
MAKYAVLKTFYNSIRWRTFRLAIIGKRGLTCEECGRMIANEREAELDHTIELSPLNVNDAMISLNPANVKLKCHECHDKRHGRFGYGKSKQVYIVFGCPGSGKTTYVMQHKARNDLIICIDRLFAAITGLPEHDKPDNLLMNIRSVYNALTDQVKTRYGKWSTAWIIGGFADKYKRERLADELGAEIIYCECSAAEALARIESDPTRKCMKAEYEKYIEEWFQRYSA